MSDAVHVYRDPAGVYCATLRAPGGYIMQRLTAKTKSDAQVEAERIAKTLPPTKD